MFTFKYASYNPFPHLEFLIFRTKWKCSVELERMTMIRMNHNPLHSSRAYTQRLHLAQYEYISHQLQNTLDTSQSIHQCGQLLAHPANPVTVNYILITGISLRFKTIVMQYNTATLQQNWSRFKRTQRWTIMKQTDQAAIVFSQLNTFTIYSP